MNNQYLFKIIIYNNCNEIVQSIDFNKLFSTSNLPDPFNNIKLYINPQMSELNNIKEKFLLSLDNKYILGIENFTINNKLYLKSDDNKSLFLSFVEYLMNNITYNKKTYIFNTTELKYPIYKIEFINNNEKVILIQSNDPKKDYLFTLKYSNPLENVNFNTIVILNKFSLKEDFEKQETIDIYEPIGTKIIQTILNYSLINVSMIQQEDIYKKNMLILEQKIKQLEEDLKNIKSINEVHKELINSINSSMSIAKKYEKSFKDCEDLMKQRQEIYQNKFNNIENECSIINPDQVSKEELIDKYNNLLKILINKNFIITSQEQNNKKLQDSLNKSNRENLILKSEKDKFTEQSKIKSSPRTPRLFNLSPPLSPRLDNKMDELIKSINSISNDNNKDNIIKYQLEQIKQLNETIKDKDTKIHELIDKLINKPSNYKDDYINNIKELLKEYINFIKNLIINFNIKDQNNLKKLNEITEINIDSVQSIKNSILIINNQFKNTILIKKETIELLIKDIININDFIKKLIGYIVQINTGHKINEEHLHNLFNIYDENCKQINAIIKPIIQNYLPNMKYLLNNDSETEYNIDDYDDSDTDDCNEDSYDESESSDNSESSDSEYDNKINNNKNSKLNSNQIYIQPIQMKNKKVPPLNLHKNNKHKIKTVNSEMNDFAKMLLNSYNKQTINKK